MRWGHTLYGTLVHCRAPGGKYNPVNSISANRTRSHCFFHSHSCEEYLLIFPDGKFWCLSHLSSDVSHYVELGSAFWIEIMLVRISSSVLEISAMTLHLITCHLFHLSPISGGMSVCVCVTVCTEKQTESSKGAFTVPMWTLGTRQEYPLDGTPLYCRASHKLIHI